MTTEEHNLLVRNLNSTIAQYDAMYNNYVVQMNSLAPHGWVSHMNSQQAKAYQELEQEANHCLEQIGVATRRLAQLGAQAQERQKAGVVVEAARSKHENQQKPQTMSLLQRRLNGGK